MGSNQSTLGEKKRALRWPHGSAGHRGQREQKTRQSSAVTVNSGRQYEHLDCVNDNSSRSSPSEEPSFAPRTKDHISSKNSSSMKFCPCFHRSYHRKQTNCSGNAIPGQNSDSVSLLQMSKCSDQMSHKTVEPRYESSLQEKLDQQSDRVSAQEILSPIGDAHRVADKFGNETSCVDFDSFCDDADNRPKINPDGSWNGQTEQSILALEPLQNIDCKNEKWLARKFLYELSGHAESKSASEQFSPGGWVICSREDVAVKTNSETNEPGYVSSATSCVDSGKASEMDTHLYPCDRSINIKAPIAKIDSLETTSIDSLDSDDLVFDTVTSSYASVEKLEDETVSKSPQKLIVSSNVCETGNLNLTLAADNAVENKQRTHDRMNTGVNFTCCDDATSILVENLKEQRSGRRSFAEEKERRRLSCPFPEASETSVQDVSLSSMPFDIVNAAKEDHSSSCVILESSDLRSMSDRECIFLNRKTYSALVGEVGALRETLLHLGAVLISQELSVDDDSKNNNVVNPSAFEDYEENHFLQSGELPDNSYLMQKLTLENKNLRQQIMLLQTVASEQQNFISSLQQKLGKVQNSMQKSDIEPLAEFHSSANFARNGRLDTTEVV